MTTRPRVGIVVVAYNAAMAVRATLASLRRARNDTPAEVVLVDNGSSDADRDAIRVAFERHVREAGLPWRLVQAERNLGFAGGNNLAIRLLLADPAITHVCLLNSDVIVPHRWLDHLLGSGCAIVSPVTNKANSEQCVPVDYELELDGCLEETREALHERVFATVDGQARRRRRAFGGNVVDCDATFFCVVLARAALERVGALDERFFPGGYEDDDYCIRARQAGVPIHLDRGVFVHHWGSASFGEVAIPTRIENDGRNRRLLEQKHGLRWQPRPGKPFVSFAQDLAFALTGRGERRLQRHFCASYGRALGHVVAQHELDFASLRVAFAAVDQRDAGRAAEALAQGLACGGLAARWRALHQEARTRIRGDGAAASGRDALLQRLRELTADVHTLVLANGVLRAHVDAHRDGPKWTPGAVRSRAARVLSALRHGLPTLLGMRGIVFLGGYPYPSRDHDGYFQRVRAIDRLFEDRWRIYLDAAPLPGPERWLDHPAARVLVLRPVGARWRRRLAWLVLGVCVLRCRAVWVHSVLRLGEHGLTRLLRPWLRPVLDVHGVVPEEYRLHGDETNGARCDEIERLAIARARAVVVVSEAMRQHLLAKHGAPRGEVIVLPVFPEIAAHRASKPVEHGRPVVVYAGGLHLWQQVPKMIDAMVRTSAWCRHRFHCTDPAAVVPLLPPEVVDDGSVLVDRRTHADLLRSYDECHYGFLLRADSVVNRVACPTKAVEYLATGVVPIVDSERVGDFAALGTCSVRLDDLLTNRLPDAPTRDTMARANRAVYERLRAQRDAGAVRVRALAGPGIASGPWLDRTLWNLAQWFPPATRRGRLLRKVWHRLRPPAVPAVPELPPCDVLMQAGNFTAGGLENVVLDLAGALRAAGMRVGLLVLGEQGPAVGRARELGLDVVAAPWSERSYRHWLLTARPKLVLSHYSVDGAAICGDLGVPLVQVIHNTYLWLRGAELDAMRASVAPTRLVVAVSDYARDDALRRLGVPADKCVVIPNGIDVARFRALDARRERARCRAALGLSPDAFVFVSVGAINHQKNQMSQLRAFAAAAASCPGAHLVVLGPPTEPALLHQCVAFAAANDLTARVTFAGAVADPAAWYAMADAFVHSSFFEGGQLSLLEALAANLPVVTVDVGFARHFRGRRGITIVPPHFDVGTYDGAITAMPASAATDSALAQAMIRVHRDPVRPDLPRAIVDSFDRANAYASYVDLVGQLANGPAAARPGRVPSAAWSHRLDAVG